MCSLTLTRELLAWGFFLLITENKRLDGSLKAIGLLVCALIPAMYLCFWHSGTVMQMSYSLYISYNWYNALMHGMSDFLWSRKNSALKLCREEGADHLQK